MFRCVYMFVPCISRRSKNYQNYILICATPFFYMLSPTCFGSSLPSSGNFIDPSELLEIQIEWVVYLKYITDKLIIMYNILFRIKQNILHNNRILLLCHSICCILHQMLYTLILLSFIHFRYTTHSICISSNSGGSSKFPDDDKATAETCRSQYIE
jgi:hypothetical protein